MIYAELPDDQYKLLEVLIDCYSDDPHPINRSTLSERLDWHPVTISTKIQNLRESGIVKSTSGPGGGYKPTAKAYDLLASQGNAETADIPITRNGSSIKRTYISRISFPEVNHPSQCRGKLSLKGDLTTFELGDRITVGPIPVSCLSIEGIVVEKHLESKTIHIEIETMYTPTTDSTT